MDSPSTKNYTLGKGICYFNKKNPETGLYDGERDLGNAPALTSNVDLTKLEHFSSRGGLKAKDMSIITEIKPMLKFTLDELSSENIAMMYLAEQESVVQTEQDFSTALLAVKGNRQYALQARKVGVLAVSYINATGVFAVGENVTGDGGAVMKVVRNIIATATTGTLYVSDIDGAFTANMEILGGTSTFTADIIAAPALVKTALCVFETAAPTTFYVLGTDYTVNHASGRIGIVKGGAAENKNITVKYSCMAATYTKLKAFKNTVIEGVFRFVSDNPAGNNRELTVWRCSLTPSGDDSYIGDDVGTIQFEGEILKDESGHPDSPYLEILIEE